MSKLYKISVFLLLFALCSGGLSAYSQDQGRNTVNKGDCAGHKHHHDKYSKIPGLTDEQKNQIEAFHTKFEKETAPAKEELGKKKEELKTLTRSEKVNMDDVNALIDQMGTLKTSIMKSEVAMKIDVWNILTDTQRNYLESLPKHHKKDKTNG
jgi:Spy/CpxP family protein refolding chaperone